ncbi:hypothetical protein CANCADRAFT_27301 [Tortispora caseinolytica NRRL Y-17796]|uniref:ATP synthase subunit J, mitochondrial n=1 Tax=Tortispora caseinolytica NRRL Y-17796 TaxID=767744 RepID=A0A1E4TA79_9ASCO|nr:hypothetical protein CANCADRAFT_27301 [Tortispora caseinolytica NRRL Y-17796]
MSFFGFRKYPTPLFKPLWPFAIGALVSTYLISKAADALMKSDEWKNDPRNPYLKK